MKPSGSSSNTKTSDKPLDGENVSDEPLRGSEYAQLLAKVEERDAAIQTLSKEKRTLTAQVAALTRAAAATALVHTSPSNLPVALTAEPSTASPLREAERGKSRAYDCYPGDIFQAAPRTMAAPCEEQEMVIARLQEEVTALKKQVQDEKEKAQSTQESTISSLQKEITFLRTQIEDERRKSLSEQELIRIEGTRQQQKVEIEVATWKRQHGEISAKQLQWETREKSLKARQEELEMELKVLTESLTKATQDVDVHAAESASLQRVIRNQESTIALLGEQQESLKDTIARKDEEIASTSRDLMPKPHQPSHAEVVDEKANPNPNQKAQESEVQSAEQETSKQIQELKKYLAYYTGLCEKQKEYIVRMEASAHLSTRGTTATHDGMRTVTQIVDEKQIKSTSASPRQYSLTLEKLEAAELKAQYWQELAQKAGVKNASAFPSSPTSPQRVPTPQYRSSRKLNTSSEDNRSEEPEKDGGSILATPQHVSAHGEPQATVEQLEELAELRHRLKVAHEEKERMTAEMNEAKDTMRREYTSLWAAVQDLNKLDATKEKAIGTLLDEKLKSDRKLSRTKLQYQKLQEELTALDEDLLSTAKAEGILKCLNEERTPTLAKRLKFGDRLSPSPTSYTSLPPYPSVAAKHLSNLLPVPHHTASSGESVEVDSQPHYLQPTIASHEQENPRNDSIKKNKRRNRSISPGTASRGNKIPSLSRGFPRPASPRLARPTSVEGWAESHVEQELRASLSELDSRLRDAKSPNRSWI